MLQLIKANHKNEYIILDRFVSKDEATEILYLSDVLILPYKHASQSGVLADALNFQLPSIVSDHPGLTENIIDGKNGFIFRNEDDQMLADKLSTYLLNEDLRLQFRDELKKLKPQLSWENFADTLLRYLKH